MRKQLKNLCIFVVVLAFVLVGCTEKMLQEPTINQTEQAIAEQEQSLPLSSWRHGYLDKAVTYEYAQFADASKRTVPVLSSMSIASKLDLLESLQQEKGKRNTADDAFYEDLVQQMEQDVEQMHITLIVEGEEYNVTEDGIEVGGEFFSKLGLLEMADQASVSNDGKRGVTASLGKWKKGDVRYRFADNPSSDFKQRTRRYMTEWEGVANKNVRFTEIKNSALNRFRWYAGDIHLKIEVKSLSHGGGSATVGGSLPYRFMQIDNHWLRNDNPRIFRHELGHVLGLHHEHQRHDRDDFITIHWDNIQQEGRSQFAKNFKLFYMQVGSVNVPIGNRTDGTYDYLSIMHYFPDAFAIDDTIPTITRKDGGVLERNVIFSHGDTLTIRNLYK